MGHVRNTTMGGVVVRFKRDVLHPMIVTQSGEINSTLGK